MARCHILLLISILLLFFAWLVQWGPLHPPGGVRGYGKMPYPPIRVQNYTNLCDFHKKRNVLRTFFVILSPHPNNFIVNDTVLTLSLDADDDHGVA